MGQGTPLTATPAAPPDPVDVRFFRDRRARPTPMLSHYSVFGGRRRGGRRGVEVEGAFVDHHGPGLFAVVTAVAALNILDAFFTILFLSYGGRELNPVVQLSLDAGVWPFIWLKSIGIGICLLFLTVTKNFRFARVGLAVIFVGYLLLLGWHGYLYTWLPDCV